jgi:hypothetical protein
MTRQASHDVPDVRLGELIDREREILDLVRVDATLLRLRSVLERP